MKRYFYIIVTFILLNSLKSWLVENIIIDYAGLSLPLSGPMLKFILYILFNAIVFFIFVRLRYRFFLILFYILQALYLFTHLAYYLYFKELFNLRQAVFQFSEGAALVRHFAIPWNAGYLIILTDLPILILAIVYFNKFYEFFKGINLRRIFFFFCAVFLMAFFFVLDPVDSYKKEDYGTNRDRPDKIIIKSYGLFERDVLSEVFFKNEDSIIRSMEYGNKIIFKNNNPSGFHNIICIQVESLDAGIIDYKYKGEYVAPFLHGLSLDSIYYPYMIAYRSIGCTADIEFTVINSVAPVSDFPFFKLTKYDYSNSFAKRLSDSGFDTIAFHNNSSCFFNRKSTFSRMGFHDFYDKEKMKLKEYGWGARDEDVFDFIKDKLTLHQKAPFMYYIITMSSHEPFNYVNLYYSNDHYNDIKNRETRDYFNSISYVDNVLMGFVSFVRNNFPNTYIFIFGDHSVYSENGILFNSAQYPYKNQLIMAVPLFIITPDHKKYYENTRVASQLDLSSTILYASGINFEIMANGINLLGAPIKENKISLMYHNKGNRQGLFRGFKDEKHFQ